MSYTKFIFHDDVFFKNFACFKEKFCLSRKALGRLLGVSVYMIEDMEKNQCKYDLPLTMIVRVSQIFGVDMNDMVSLDLSNKSK